MGWWQSSSRDWGIAGALISLVLSSGAWGDSRDMSTASPVVPPTISTGADTPASGTPDVIAQAPVPATPANPPAAPASPSVVPASPPAAPAESGSSNGGSDRSIRISGTGELLGWAVLSGSTRQSIFSRNNANSDFLLTHVHPALTATLGPKALAYGEFCITHPRVGPQPELGYFEYDVGPRLNFQVGRFLVPFGQWNTISNVYDHKSIAYPLMYIGHEEEELVLQGGPRPLASTGWSDLGLVGYGSIWPSSSDQIWYGGYVCNGRFGGTDIEWEDLWNNYRDNNSDKAFGGRLVWTHGDNVSIGASYQTGKYDVANRYGYQFGGTDLYARLFRKMNLRAEYVSNPVDSPVQGYTKTGWYVSADSPIDKKHEVVVMYSHLREYPDTRIQNMGRASIGFNTFLTRSLKLKTEIDHIFIGHFTGNAADATATQFGTSFQDVTRFRASVVAIF